MAFAATSADHRDFSSINITPLVDVMLVLLVIFMIAAPAMTRSLDWSLPQPVPQLPTPPKTLALSVQAGDVLSLDGQAVSRSQLATLLAQNAVAQGLQEHESPLPATLSNEALVRAAVDQARAVRTGRP